MNRLTEHLWIIICGYLLQKDLWSLLQLSNFAIIFANSSVLLRKFTLVVDKDSSKVLMNSKALLDAPFMNSLFFLDEIEPKIFLKLLENYKNSLENLTLNNFSVKNSKILSENFHNFTNLKFLNLKNCKMDESSDNFMSIIKSLKSVRFHNCNGNFMKFFKNHKNIEKIIICSYDYTFNGFDHESFNDLVSNLPNLNHLVLVGVGTSSYLDADSYPFKITILETDSVTFHWYVGIRTARLDFLKTQKGFLKELTIHKLPFDFDGHKVLKFIIEDMNLDKFYYGKTPLILNRIKQQVLEFSATEVQVKATFEMFRQFSTIKKFTLILNNTDVCSDAIEKVINPKTYIFDNLNEFILFDKSGYRGLFGVFLPLYQNLRNIKKVKFDTQDRNLNVILEECLPKMKNLDEICLTSQGPNPAKRFEIIKKSVKLLKRLTIPADQMMEAKKIFQNQVEIIGI